jgi:hypothetical protein
VYWLEVYWQKVVATRGSNSKLHGPSIKDYSNIEGT